MNKKNYFYFFAILVVIAALYGAHTLGEKKGADLKDLAKDKLVLDLRQENGRLHDANLRLEKVQDVAEQLAEFTCRKNGWDCGGWIENDLYEDRIWVCYTPKIKRLGCSKKEILNGFVFVLDVIQTDN